MDKRIQEFIDNFNRTKIGVDETFKFHCTQCGKCCMYREDILLTPKDLFNIAKELNITIKDALTQYCEIYLGRDSRMPIVRLKPQGAAKRCPLLKDKKCSVHKSKPTVCALFPIGRVIAFENVKDIDIDIQPNEVNFIFTDPGCGDETETHTVREWLSYFNIPIEDEYFLKWNNIMAKLSMFLCVAEKRFLEKRFNQILDTVFGALYCLYDTDEEFLPQLERNVAMLEIALKKHGYKKEKQNEG